jgi:hypothetical protein
MPTVNGYVEIEVSEYTDIDVEVESFLSECSRSEIDEVIDYLIEHNFIDESSKDNGFIGEENLMDIEWLDTLKKLRSSRLVLSEEDIETIKKIANKV